MDNFTFFYIFGIVCIAITFISVSKYIQTEKRKQEQLRKYLHVYQGMNEIKMLSIMGSSYNKSTLKNNRTKYEWRINAKSYGTSFNGLSVRDYTGVKKVSIYVRNGIVEEIKPYNV